MNVLKKKRQPWYGQPGIFIITSVLLLALIVSCTSADSESPGQATPAIAEQEVTPTMPVPTDTAEAPMPTDTVEAPVPADTLEATVPAGWMTYTNQGCEYTISYPPEMQISDQDTTSHLLAFNLDEPGAGALNFIYVSLVDRGSPASGEGIIYNYDPAETEILLNMKVGESKPSRDFADVAAWFTYERKPDTPIGGLMAQTYENVRPWEFPSGTKEIRYYLLSDECTYLIGGYMDTIGSGQPGAIDEGLFDQIVATIQLP